MIVSKDAFLGVTDVPTSGAGGNRGIGVVAGTVRAACLICKMLF